MTPIQEKKLLTALFKRLDQTDVGIIGRPFFPFALWVALAIAFTVMFHLADNGSMPNDALVIVAGVIGAFVGWILFYRTALTQWPVVRQHIDRDTVEKRLRELETQSTS